MSHRSPQESSQPSPQQNPQPSHLSSPTRTEGARPEVLVSNETSSHSAAPRWEQRHRAPSQREPLPREQHEPDARRGPRWNVPDGAPQEADAAAFQPQWSEDELEDLAHETMAHRGRKLSPRRARALAARARRRHVNARRPEPKTKRPPLWRFFRAVALCLAAVACVELGAAALTSPRFAVQQITSDTVEITPEVAIDQAKASLMGQNVFRVRPQANAKKLAALPAVKSVSIFRQLDWPPHLHISIEERQPFARVDDGGQWWVVDENGVPFRRAAPQDTKLYAVSSKGLKPKIGEKLKTENWAPVVEFAQALKEDEKQGHDWALRAIYFDEHGFASLRLAESNNARDRMLVHLGTGPWDKKLERTRQALTWLEDKGVHAETLNMISAKRPVWTPRRIEPDKNVVATKADSDNHPA